MSLTLSDWKDIATIAGVIVALIALFKGVYEYVKQGSQKRAEQFIEMEKRFDENKLFREISSLTEDDNAELRGVAYKDKVDYLGFFEEIALLVNSKLISPEIAHYMFGYYTMRCWESENFWAEINKESIYGIVFKKFVEKMKLIETNFEYDEKKLRF